MLPSLPVKNSVLHQLGIEDCELPHGLARLKQNLLIPPSHTRSQESNICSNSGSSDGVGTKSALARFYRTRAAISLRLGLGDIIAKNPSCSDPIEETFKSLSYLDQIALTCLAADCVDCRAPDCLQYRRKLESVVPVCRSWPGLRDWVLCITSCSLRKARDINLSGDHAPDRLQDLGDEKSKNGLSVEWAYWDEDLLSRFRIHIAALLVLTHSGPFDDVWNIAERTVEADNLSGTDESGLSGSIGRGSPFVSSRRCPVLPLKF